MDDGVGGVLLIVFVLVLAVQAAAVAAVAAAVAAAAARFNAASGPCPTMPFDSAKAVERVYEGLA